MKRLFDFSISLLLISITSPFLLLIALLIRIHMGGPVLFKQKRPGIHAQPFYVYKFRTMNEARSESGELLADNERITKLGSFLRKNSLDELPQLLNVLKGEMSLVGPRPLLIEYLPLYTKEQALRHHVKPGITGWAQINGRNAITWREKFALDIWYVKNQSAYLDLKILFYTLWKVIKRDDINQRSNLPMEKFNGKQEVQ